MLTELRIQNFKAIENLVVPLRPLTVLIGPNDSGKSTILQALDLVGRSTHDRVDELFEPSLEPHLFQKKTDRKLELVVKGAGLASYEVHFRTSDRDYACFEQLDVGDGSLLVTRDGGTSIAKDPHSGTERRHEQWLGQRTFLAEMSPPNRPASESPTWAAVARALSSLFVRFDASRLAAPCPLQVGKAPPALDDRGFGLAALIDYLANKQSALRAKLEQDLSHLVPTLEGVGTDTVRVGGESGKALAFRLANASGVDIPAALASDGALLAAGYLALAYGSDASRFLIDEPENGLHPYLLRFVVDLFRRISTGTVGGRARQVILTTHSPILLNFVEPEEVLLVVRDQAGAVRVKPMTETEGFESRFEDYDLGELWYNVGESKLVL